ncbi:hypothetical protein RUND412_004415 [Rhizina undulata]
MKTFTILALSFLSTAPTLVTPAPTPTIEDFPTIVQRAAPSNATLGSHQQPVVLPSGNKLLSPYLYQQVRNGTPDTPFISDQGHFGVGIHTYQAFEFITEDFSGRNCKFHFIMGPGDGGSGYGEVFAITGGVDETTTWNNRPGRMGPSVAGFDVAGGKGERFGVSDDDAYFDPERVLFPCPIGKIAWEIAPADPAIKSGIFGNSANWSWNKGLLIERV